ncbi:hypothetical protein, partial [Streptomyces galilaeus]|uniref:hypothetical protein n=1 Tax=Streptomyces galilaeus TaxID=33899 RepID=UPI0038F6511A
MKNVPINSKILRLSVVVDCKDLNKSPLVCNLLISIFTLSVTGESLKFTTVLAGIEISKPLADRTVSETVGLNSPVSIS